METVCRSYCCHSLRLTSPAHRRPPPTRRVQVSKLAKNEVLMLNIGSMCTGARVLAVKHDLAKLQLTSPVCTKEGEKIALSRRVDKHWRLIGWGQIQKGLKMEGL